MKLSSDKTQLIKVYDYDIKNGTFVIPDSVIKIADNAFANVTGSTWYGIFYKQSKFEYIHIPNNVTEIGNSAFKGCINLTHVHISTEVITIGYNAFANCTSLKHIDIPTGLTQVADGVFNGCSQLTEAHIPESVTEIGASAFANCTSLSMIRLPEGVMRVRNDVFENCSSLMLIAVDSNNQDKINRVRSLIDIKHQTKICSANIAERIQSMINKGLERILHNPRTNKIYRFRRHFNFPPDIFVILNTLCPQDNRFYTTLKRQLVQLPLPQDQQDSLNNYQSLVKHYVDEALAVVDEPIHFKIVNQTYNQAPPLLKAKLHAYHLMLERYREQAKQENSTFSLVEINELFMHFKGIAQMCEHQSSGFTMDDQGDHHSANKISRFADSSFNFFEQTHQSKEAQQLVDEFIACYHMNLTS